VDGREFHSRGPVAVFGEAFRLFVFPRLLGFSFSRLVSASSLSPSPKGAAPSTAPPPTMSDDKKLLKTLNKLRKLSANKSCASCNAVSESPLGYMNVVPLYKMFVCNMCKSALQSYSIRVKSTSQSSFDPDEVDSFKDKYGGGNKNARIHWFANLDMDMPDPNRSTLNEYKRFIEMTFLEERWKYDSNGSNKKKKKKKDKKDRKEKKEKKKDKKKDKKNKKNKFNQDGPTTVIDEDDFFGTSAPTALSESEEEQEHDDDDDDDFFGAAPTSLSGGEGAGGGVKKRRKISGVRRRRSLATMPRQQRRRRMTF
jgi:hypothetical protein